MKGVITTSTKASELLTSVTYTANGTQKVFSIPFDYLRGSFIHVNVNNEAVSDFEVINRTLEFAAAPAAGATIYIYRETPTERLVSWADASVLKASDMTISQVQQLHIIEEGQDWSKINSIVLNNNVYDAGMHRVVNVANPEQPQDAMTLAYYNDTKTGIVAAINAAKNEAVTASNAAKNEAIQAGKTATQKAEEASASAQKAAEYASMPGVPIGSRRLIFNLLEKDVSEILATGVEYTRAAYTDLYAWAQEKELVIPEAEWQAKLSDSDGKFVPWYSDGDGSTTFRTPLYGAYYNEVPTTFDASRCVPTADENRPKTMYGIYVIKAYGVVTNTGAQDVTEIAAGLTRLEEDIFKFKMDVDYSIPSPITATKTSVTIPGNLMVTIGNNLYRTITDTQLQLSTVGTLGSLAGKNIYIYACQPATGNIPVLLLSLNSTVPTGYTAVNSRKIGGFHCLCADAGNIANHPLSDYVAGNILPASIWHLKHRPKGDPEGFAYLEILNVWLSIYGLSWDGTKLVSVFNGIWANGFTAKKWHGELLSETLIRQKMRLPSRDEFRFGAEGSNEQTSIRGSFDSNTTGGHIDTAGRRMLSNIGLEDCNGVLWQWLLNVGFAGGSAWDDSVYNKTVDNRKYGQSYGTFFRLRAGGCWLSGGSCGSRCVSCADTSAYVAATSGARAVSEPLAS